MSKTLDFSPTEFHECELALLRILLLAAPDKTAQREVDIAFKEIQRHAHNRTEVLKSLTAMIYEGLAYGNWVWLLKGTR